MSYKAVCSQCGAVVLVAFERLGDEQVTAMLTHLWQAHPQIVTEPSTPPLGELLRLVHVRHEPPGTTGNPSSD